MILLDLFCCEGGAARGYQLAGFEVFGVDINPKFATRYAGDWFTAASALDVLATLLEGGSVAFHSHAPATRELTLNDIAAIHASPPCQPFSIAKNGTNHRPATPGKHQDLVEATRTLLQRTGKPYVIENVVGAPLLNPTMLCWSMFNEAGSVLDDDGTPLRMERHRLFETNWELTAPREDYHDKAVQVAGAYGGARRDKWEAKHVRKGGYVPSIPVQRELLDIHWMTQYGMWQSVPPKYTEYIGLTLAKMCS